MLSSIHGNQWGGFYKWSCQVRKFTLHSFTLVYIGETFEIDVHDRYVLSQKHTTHLSGSGNINKICKLQDRAFSLFLISNNSNSLASNKLFKFKSLISYCVSVKLHCYLNSSVNLHIKSVLDQLKPAHQHATRFVTQGNFNLPAARSTKYQQSFIFKSVGYWNEIDPDVRSITSSKKFKRKLKCFLLMNQI